jgi:hypothetical protein
MSAVKIAQQIIEQWENHDIYRSSDADKFLWSSSEPNEVLLAREFLRLLDISIQTQNSNCQSHAANDVLKSAVNCYKKMEQI